jgi:hypothetical protein
MRQWILILALGALLTPGCTTVEQGSRKARAVAVTTGDHIEAGLNTAAVKTRNWWQRMFGPRESKPAPAPTPTPNPRYRTVDPQYVGTAPGS